MKRARQTKEQKRSYWGDGPSHDELIARAERALAVIPDDPYAGVVLFVMERLLNERSAARARREQARAAEQPKQRARSRAFRKALGAAD